MTKAATIESHRFLCLVVLVAMLITMIPVTIVVLPGGVLAGDNSTVSSDVSGDFTVNSGEPVVESLTLHSNGGGATSSMSPTTQYEMWVNVTENNTMEDIDTIVLTLYHDANGEYAYGDMPGSPDNNNCAIITYTNLGSDTWVLSNSSTTWAVASGSEAPAGTATNGDFKFEFIVGKVALETTGAAEWHAYAIATDDDSNTGSDYQEDLTMNWYGEITSVTNTVTFGNVSLGATQDVSEAAISANYICNGDYYEQIRTTATWNGTSENLTLDVDGSPGDSAFSIRADDDNGITDAVYVQAAVYTSIDASGTYTPDVGGTADADNYLWLWLGATGIPAETYNGTLYFAIANR